MKFYDDVFNSSHLVKLLEFFAPYVTKITIFAEFLHLILIEFLHDLHFSAQNVTKSA